MSSKPIIERRTSKIAFARTLRSSMTPGERVIWKKIRAKRFHNLKFRRQVPIGPFIVDFLCLEKKLVIEIDGYTHGEQSVKEYDKRRERYLRKRGFAVLRFTNVQAVESTEIVLNKIRAFLKIKLEEVF